jgi:hypothetical protein
MKLTHLSFAIGFAVLLSIVGCGGKATLPPHLTLASPQNTVETDAILSGQTFVYRHVTRYEEGTQATARRRIPVDSLLGHSTPDTEESRDIFGLLADIHQNARRRDVKKVSDGTISMVVLEGLQLIVGGEKVALDAVATLEVSDKKPRRYTFSAQTDAQPAIEKFEVVYRWGEMPFEGGLVWAPVEIRSEVVIQRQGIGKRYAEGWLLETILPKAQDADSPILQTEAQGAGL